MEPEIVSIKIPFPTFEIAEIVYKVLAVDVEKGEIQRELQMDLGDERDRDGKKVGYLYV